MEPIESLASLEEIHRLSSTSGIKAVAIYKHSTRCHVCSMVKRLLQDHWHFETKDLPLYYLDLLQFREISNAIASKYGVVHQSPQLLVIKGGKCIYTASQGDINVQEVEQLFD